jgi:very-short-patch-repair endonuclease
MRHAPTASEEKLFGALRGGKLGVTFRRQVALAGKYIADFYASEVKLVVEVDGGYHVERERADGRRDRALAKLGIHVLRLPAQVVMSGEVASAVERVRVEVVRLLGAR